MGEKDELSIKYMFEKLLEREDKFILVIENLDDSIVSLKDTIISHENSTECQRKNCNQSHEELSKTIKELKKGDRSLINTLFKVAFVIFIVLAIGKEFIGVENIINILK